jgi:hypothetical protein
MQLLLILVNLQILDGVPLQQPHAQDVIQEQVSEQVDTLALGL